MKKILFKPEMIRAIIDGKKTQTRRLVKYKRKSFLNMMYNPQPLPSKYKVGEVVYIGESYCLPGACVAPIRYRADEYDGCKCCDLPRWQNAMFMPEKYARLFLKITGVKAHILHEINTEEAAAEGFKSREAFWDYFLKINGDPSAALYIPVYAYTFEVVKK